MAAICPGGHELISLSIGFGQNADHVHISLPVQHLTDLAWKSHLSAIQYNTILNAEWQGNVEHKWDFYLAN